jgi:ribosomal protein S12 methylthiotransferase accessory factor
MNQMLALSFGENEPQGIARGLDSDLNEWFRDATTATEAHLMPDPDVAPNGASHWKLTPSDDILEDLLFCKACVERIGLELLIIDQTRPDVGMPAVKVVVPGLRHFWPRFAPGRLYDVPVRLGKRDRPLREEELNPRRMFF